MYETTATTGQRNDLVLPKYTSTPFPNWSHLDTRRWTLTIDGFRESSTATFPHFIPPELRVSWLSEDGSNSPRRKNPAKQK